MMLPINAGPSTAAEVIQQAFSPAVAVLASPDVDILCAKNRLSFVELLQPFSRLSVEGQIRDVNQSLHLVTHFRLSVRDINWKPASVVLARRLLSESVTNYTVGETKFITHGEDSIEINPHTPWFDAWRETLWNCLEMTEHDFARHYQATFLVVSSSHSNPADQFQQLNDHLNQLMANNGTNDGPRWFNSMALRYYILVHDAIEGNASKAEEQFGGLRNTYGFHNCHLLVINSKPKKATMAEAGLLPAPDPWLRFLPRKLAKAEGDFSSTDGGCSEADGTGTTTDLPSKVVEDTPSAGVQQMSGKSKTPLMDALQEAMQEVNIFPPSASTLALSSLGEPEEPSGGTNNGNGTAAARNQAGLVHRSAVEIKDDPLARSGSASTSPTLGLEENKYSFNHGPLDAMDGRMMDVSGELHGGCLTTDDVDRIQMLINEFCLKSLLPHIERQMKLLNEAASARKSTHRSLLSATKRWFGSQRPGGGLPGLGGGTQSASSQAAVAVSYHPESAQLQVRRLGDLAFLVGHYDLAYSSYHSAKKDFEADAAWLHFAGAAEMAALSAFLASQQQSLTTIQTGLLGGQRTVPFHYFDTALTTYLQTCRMANWATRCAVLASECHKAVGQYKEAAHQLILLTSEDADLRSAILLEQAALCFLRSGLKGNSSDLLKPNMSPLVRKYAFHMILAGHRFGKAGQKRHASRAYQLALQVYRDHGWSLAEDHIHYTVGRQCLNGQQVEAACQALAALLKPGSQQSAAQQSAYLNEFIHVHQLLVKQKQSETGVPPALPVLPLPIVESNQIRVLVETKEPDSNLTAGMMEATHVTFSDEEVNQPKWAVMEERLMQAGLGLATTPPSFRPTTVLFTDATNNTMQPQTFCDELVSLEVPLNNPLRIAVQLCDARLLWRFSGADGQLSNAHLPAKTAADNPLVTTYVIPRILLNPHSTHKVIFMVRPKAEGMLTIEGLAFDLRPSSSSAEPSGGTTASVSGRVGFSVRGPRLNSTQQERYGQVYAPDRRLSIQVGPAMPRLRVAFRSWPEFLFSGEVRAITVQLSDARPSIPAASVLLASSDPSHLAADLPRVHHPRWTDGQVAVYRWEPAARQTATIWLRGSDQPGLNPMDLMFFYANPSIKARYRVVRHCTKVFVSSSLSLQTWVQRIPSVPVNELEGSAETVSIQLQVRNLRDADDTSLSGIEVRQVALMSDRWRLRSAQSVVMASSTPEKGVIHPQESLICALLAVRGSKEEADGVGGFCESVAVGKSSGRTLVDFRSNPYRTLVHEKDNSHTTLAVSWTASQASEDGLGSTVIEGLHYYAWNGPDIVWPGADSKVPQQLITYSMDYSTKVSHNFLKQRLCVIPVVLHVHNCSHDEMEVHFSATSNSIGKGTRATQLYMPEAASPLMWLGRVRGQERLQKASEAVIHLAVAVTRPGAYSLAQGLQLDASKITGQQSLIVQSTKMEFTLIVDQEENS